MPYGKEATTALSYSEEGGASHSPKYTQVAGLRLCWPVYYVRTGIVTSLFSRITLRIVPSPPCSKFQDWSHSIVKSTGCSLENLGLIPQLQFHQVCRWCIHTHIRSKHNSKLIKIYQDLELWMVSLHVCMCTTPTTVGSPGSGVRVESHYMGTENQT